MIILTSEEHEEWIHLCDKAGKELDPRECRDCDILSYCLNEHSIVGEDVPLALRKAWG